MTAACGHGNHIACLHILLHTVHNGLALACNDRPDLITVLMAVVVHLMACIQGHLDGHGRLVDVDDFKAAPRFLSKHHSVVECVDIWLNVAGLLFVGHQNALRAGRDHHILQTHTEDRHIQFVDHMDVLALLIKQCLAHRLAVHRLGQGVPSAKVFPSACEAHDLNFRLMLHHGIVEADFVQGIVFIEQVIVVYKINELMGAVQHIAQLECEHAAVPERALCNVVLCHFLRGLFLEHGHLADLLFADGDDVAIFLAGVGRLNAHQDQICTADSGTVAQRFQRLKVVVLHIGVYRADDHSFFLTDALHVLQVGCCQSDSRKSIAAARLHADAHFFAQLIVDGRDLRLGGRNGDRCIRIDRLDLTVDALHHGFQFAVFPMEDLNELLGTNIIGKRPQTLAGAAGQ